jgi:hypothetical protein
MIRTKRFEMLIVEFVPKGRKSVFQDRPWKVDIYTDASMKTEGPVLY